MTTYLSPGVYVEEIPSGLAPIAGVGTSTAGFIGVFDKGIIHLLDPVEDENVGTGDGSTTEFPLSQQPVLTEDDESDFLLLPRDQEPQEFTVKVGDTVASGVELEEKDDGQFVVKFTNPPANDETITVDYQPIVKSPQEGEVKLCTNFSEFKKFFGDFSPPEGDAKGQNILAHAVYGFFRNGGTRCYVTWGKDRAGLQTVLDEQFEAIDEIAIVAAPGCDATAQGSIKDHCEKMGDRFAVLDSEETADLSSSGLVDDLKPFNSDYAALYFPWIQVFDPASNGNIWVPPSGHIAGVYARVDNQRGVYKAPANETILGALDLKYNLSKAKQDGLNPDGINCIRKFNGNILIWGARTIGGDANGEFKYLNIRRYFNYLKESIDEGTQWTVFEPNNPELWAKIRRNITAFLTTEWRQGALFGTTPQEAFFVKCDAENNPPEVRDLGQVVTEIGVAVIKPAEFVIFKLSQWTGT